MSGSVEVVLWLHEYELKALDKHLASNGTDVEKRMQEMLADLYSECVPFEERQAIPSHRPCSLENEQIHFLSSCQV